MASLIAFKNIFICYIFPAKSVIYIVSEMYLKVSDNSDTSPLYLYTDTFYFEQKHLDADTFYFEQKYLDADTDTSKNVSIYKRYRYAMYLDTNDIDTPCI